jgi:hypothetical protein
MNPWSFYNDNLSLVAPDFAVYFLHIFVFSHLISHDPFVVSRKEYFCFWRADKVLSEEGSVGMFINRCEV